jgi:hypothetical protein
MVSAAVAFAAGSLFAAGLCVSGMTQPAKVLGFLDVAGAWDASLAFVMIGAIGVHAVMRRLALRLRRPLGAAAFEEPTRRGVDGPLVVGAAIFGVGWGLGGYCPGPAIVSLGTGSTNALVFVAMMAFGMWLHRIARANARGVVAKGMEVSSELGAQPARMDG